MRASGKALAACALLSFSPLCLAEAYIGAGGIMSSYKYDDVKRGIGPQVFAGYRLDTLPLMFEFGYLDTGKNKVDGSFALYDSNTGQTFTVSNMGISWSGALASVGYFAKWDANGSNLYGKVGYYGGKSKLTGDVSGYGSGSTSEGSNGLMLGVGADWMINPSFGIRFDLGSLLRVKTIPGYGEKSNLTTFGISAVFAFGGSDAPIPRVAEPAAQVVPLDEPKTSAAVAMTAEPSMPAPKPVAAQSAPLITNGQVTANAGAIVRDAPLLSASISTVIKDGGTLTLGSRRVLNSNGGWWYVSNGSAQGWMNENDMQH